MPRTAKSQADALLARFAKLSKTAQDLFCQELMRDESTGIGQLILSIQWVIYGEDQTQKAMSDNIRKLTEQLNPFLRRKKDVSKAIISLHLQNNKPLRIKKLLTEHYGNVTIAAIRGVIHRFKTDEKRSVPSERS